MNNQGYYPKLDLCGQAESELHVLLINSRRMSCIHMAVVINSLVAMGCLFFNKCIVLIAGKTPSAIDCW